MRRRHIWMPLVVPMTLGLLGGCHDPNVKRHPVPSGEKLRAEDCGPAEQVYRRLLALPPRVGTVVTSRSAPLRSEEQQGRAAQAFAIQCATSLVGNSRRAIIHCWFDAPDSESFQGCTQRF